MATLTVTCSNLVVACLLLSLWPSASAASQGPLERGKAIYGDKCAVCHGDKGKGDGPVAASLPAKSPDFSDSKFWRGDTEKLIGKAIEKGKGIMPPIALEPGEVKDVTNYMTRTFKPQR